MVPWIVWIFVIKLCISLLAALVACRIQRVFTIGLEINVNVDQTASKEIVPLEYYLLKRYISNEEYLYFVS